MTTNVYADDNTSLRESSFSPTFREAQAKFFDAATDVVVLHGSGFRVACNRFLNLYTEREGW